MGMGKTLSALALIVRTLEDADAWSAASDSSQNRCRATLVLLPSASMCNDHQEGRNTNNILKGIINNWINEINMYVPKTVGLFASANADFRHLDGTMKVIRYHGERRKGLLREIETADVVLTTYHTLLWEFESKESPLHKLTWFRLVLDEGKSH